MGQRNLIAIGIAIFLGLIAVYAANVYFSARESQQERVAEENRMARIVVSSQDLAFGAPLTAQNVRLANWPATSVPVGAFTSIEEVTRNRVALRPIVPGEPILASKVSGTDGRATLSANLPLGQLAYAIPVNDVAGVGGFVRPGDVVDVILTRQIPGEGNTGNDKMTDILLEAVPVLGIDQVADEKNTQPAVGKTATLQVDTYGAQKLALALQSGTLSLALRNVADQVTGARKTVTRADLGGRYFLPARGGSRAPSYAAAVPRAIGGAARRTALPSAPAGVVSAMPRMSGPTMTIVRGTRASEEEFVRGY
ncbi:pilus assembly protein CpaB [Novosphingobium kunmingense]|uniref:Pilus assembly protein CpaB n=1 Tax=Novosphingobium kunmingense TaxID=1211806 RepID=A0A2N0H6D9_9SPHN|nr:Flp pilus assembly protein CpaB [Novosphingobium kunmingense]PKB14514.1 pilus assembly protein CpaB [Novosphingobium kunmingense]